MTTTDIYQPVLEVAQAYGALDAGLLARLQAAFDGEASLADQLALAQDIVRTTRPADLALVLCRLIAVVQDTTDGIEPVPEEPSSNRPIPLVQQVHAGINAMPHALREQFREVQQRRIDLDEISGVARQVVTELAPRDLWRVLAGQMLVNASGN